MEADLGFALVEAPPGGGRLSRVPLGSPRELAAGPTRLRVGLLPDGKAPARDGTTIADLSGRPIGIVTSGGFGPTVGGPVAMGYVDPAFAAPGTKVALSVRGKDLPATVTPLPFVPHRYFRKARLTRG